MRVEDVDETTARARNIIVSLGVLFCIRNHQEAVKITNSERRISRWNIWVREWESCRLQDKIFVVRLNLAGVKVGDIKEIVIVGHAPCHAFINRTGSAVIHGS